MKTFLTGLFLLISLSVIAQTRYSTGPYKIDPSTELIIGTSQGSMAQLDGSIEMKEDFENSTVILFDDKSDPNVKFVSTGISGSLEKFFLKGDLTLNGVTKQVVFDTRYLGIVADGYGHDKAAFIGRTKIYSQKGEEISVDLRLLASRPSRSTEEMYETVYHMVK